MHSAVSALQRQQNLWQRATLPCMHVSCRRQAPPILPIRALCVWGRTPRAGDLDACQQLAPVTPFPFPLQVLYLGATVVLAAGAWLVDYKLGRLHSNLRHFEGATTATFAHQSAQLALLRQLSQQVPQLAQLPQASLDKK